MADDRMLRQKAGHVLQCLAFKVCDHVVIFFVIAGDHIDTMNTAKVMFPLHVCSVGVVS